MLFFKKKKKVETPAEGKGFVPVDRVKELQAKGFTEIEIIDMLRREGFSPKEIDQALIDALKKGVSAKPKTQEKPPELPTLEELTPPKKELSEPPKPSITQPVQTPAPKPPPVPQSKEVAPPQPTLPPVQAPPAPAPAIPEQSLPEEYYYPESYTTEEYIDYIVKEKTSEINEKLNEFMLKYKELSSKINELNERLAEISKSKGTEQELISTKIDSFKEMMNDIDTRLQSLEKAFKETLPALIEGVRALSEIVQRMKKEA